MGIHKLTAGSGYDYLTRQVAALDATDTGRVGLDAYYTARGESPGHWLGSGMAGIDGLQAGDVVTAAQMRNLFGHGLHPLATELDAPAATPAAPVSADSGRLGLPFKVYEGDVSPFRVEVARRLEESNRRDGLPADWPVPAAERARVRTAVASELFRAEHGRDPADARELAGVIARLSRPRTTAVAGYDLTFSPVKSVSVLWAVADPAIARVIEQAHHAAVADALRFIEGHALFTRLGANGVRQVETRGLVAAAFDHRDSRAGDPDLHTHVAVANKVQTRDGRWLAIDGRVLFKATVAASETYNTALETHLHQALGVAFVERPGGDPRKRPVREIVGVDPALSQRWSARRVSIDARRAQLAVAFQRDHGRPPTPVEALQLAQQATLETRQAKHEPRSLGEQRATWRTEAGRVLGGDAGIEVMVHAALHPPTEPAPTVSAAWLDGAAGRVVAAMEADRAIWQAWHVRAEAQRQVRPLQLPAHRVGPLVDLLTTEVLQHRSTLLARPDDGVVEPPQLRRTGGASVYTVAGADLYTSSAVLAAERRLVALAGQAGGQAVPAGQVDLTLLELAANGVTLNPGQAELVRAMATSGARVQLGLAPAGTGKTTAMQALAAAWAAAGGTVVGLAPSAAAAAQLRDQVDAPTDTLAKLVWSIHHDDLPAWAAGMGPGSLVIIDEAGMADTISLDTVCSWVVGRGGSVRLIGDDQQLAAIGAGGVLRDIATTHGAARLTELVRFTDPAEAGATLALRDGRPEALGFYLDRGRVHVGDLATVTDQLFAAWRADRDTGLDSLMLAPTRELVSDLNCRARADRLTHALETASPPTPVAGPAVGLADGNLASAGDVILTRANDRRLRVSAIDWVKNGDRWTVHTVHRDGSLTARHLGHGRRVRLPADYVADSVELGYATTVHAAQGVTADTMQGLLTGEETRPQLYTMATRGRTANHLYLQVVGDGDPHSVIRPELVHPATPTDLLEAALGRDTAPRSATTTRRDLHDPTVRLGEAAARYLDAVHVAATDHAGPALLTHLDRTAEQVAAGLTAEPAWPTLRARLLLLHAADGLDPAAALTAAAGLRDLDTAHDRAAVLDHRLPTPRGNGPLPWLPPIPTQLVDHPSWGRYLASRARLVTDLTAQVETAAPDHPAWVPPGTTPTRQLIQQVEVWRAATQIDPGDRRPTGQPRRDDAAASWQRRLDEQLADGHTPAVQEWGPAIRAAGISAARDPFLPMLAARLAVVSRAGIDAHRLLQAAIAESPLPDDHGAAALWWRIMPHLEPATVGDPGPSGSGGAAGVDRLDQYVGLERAAALQASPAFAALVTVIDHCQQRGHRLDHLLAPIAVPDGVDEGQQLVWTLSLLLDPVPDPDGYAPFADTPPDDLHLATAHPPAEAAAPVGHEPDPSAAAQLAAAAMIVRGPAGPSEADLRRALDRRDAWHASPIGRDRIVSANTLAAAYFAEQYRDSWSRTYLSERLGADITSDVRFRPGHAPDLWTGLVRHLRSCGVTDPTMEAAGLVIRTRDGRLIDRFRNRLVLPIVHDNEILGFVARRHPDLTDDDRAGPKYLNTADTLVFNKGAQLYRPTGDDRFATVPVLVEGPLDAIAVTLAGGDRYAGYASLGTALTTEQAVQLGRLGADPIVAFDNDPAGQAAAGRAYWLLATHGLDPLHATWPAGADPADTLYRHGPAAVTDVLRAATPLADTLTTDLSAALPADEALDRAVAVLAARPARHWADGLEHLGDAFGAHPAELRHQLLDHVRGWMEDPHRAAETAVADLKQATSRTSKAAGPVAGPRIRTARPESLDYLPDTPDHTGAATRSTRRPEPPAPPRERRRVPDPTGDSTPLLQPGAPRR